MPVILHEPERRPKTTAITDEETGAMLRAFFNLADRWALSDREARILMGQPAARTFARWKSGAADLSRVPHDTRQRLSMLMGIHKGLRLLFPENPELRYSWVTRRNQVLEGRTPLEVMLEDGLVGLARIARLVDFQRGQ